MNLENFEATINELHGRQTVNTLLLELLLTHSAEAKQAFSSINPENFEGLLLARQMPDDTCRAAVAHLASLRDRVLGEAVQ